MDRFHGRQVSVTLAIVMSPIENPRGDSESTRLNSESTSDPAPQFDRVGPYRILERIGEGGFGEVYSAEQVEPIRRRVALKVIKAGMNTRAVLARFDAERQALAIMDHPNIAKVLDAGATDQGRPYFVMELVKGEPLTTYCDRHALSTRERLALFIPICRAVQHAHQKGIIHRDLKPSNILVSVADGDPVPKVIDFGVAKATGKALIQETLYTHQGQLIGTPEYMSPEQAEMGALDVDTRTDIYSLGVVLYEVLTGLLPFSAEELRRAGLAEIQRIIREKDPPRPSTRVSSLGKDAEDVARRRHTNISRLTKLLRGELDWILLKAMEKDRTRRYETAVGLAQDIERHLRNEPVVARPPSTSYRLSKLARRNRVPLAFATVVVVSLIVAVFQKTMQQRETDAALSQAEAATAFLAEMISSIEPENQGRNVTLREVLNEMAGSLSIRFQDEPIVEARLRSVLGNAYFALGDYPAASNHFQELAALSESLYGERDRRTLEARLSTSSTDLALSRITEARDALTRGLAISRQMFGTTDTTTIGYLGLLGQAHMSWSDTRLDLESRSDRDTQRAEALLREALEACESLSTDFTGKDALLNDLATLYTGEQRFAGADSLRAAALRLQQSRLGADHPKTVATKVNLGAQYSIQGRYADAERLLTEGLAGQRRLLGNEHPRTLGSFQNLAIVKSQLGKFDEAAALFAEAFQGRENAFGIADLRTLSSGASLASSYSKLGRFAEADRLYQKLVSAARTLLPAPESGIELDEGTATGFASSLEDWGECLLALDRTRDAERTFREAYSMLTSTSHVPPSTCRAFSDRVAILYESAGEPALASGWRERQVPDAGMGDSLGSP